MRFGLSVAAAAGLLGFACAAPAPAAVAAGPSRVIDIGTIVGRTSVATLAATSTATVNQFLGVPFAAVPTGSLRFLPPANPPKLSKPLTVTTLPPACVQQFAGSQLGPTNEEMQYNNPFGPFPVESEDCLYLNVYAPKDASPTNSNKKAVMVWIFGGEMQFGSSSDRWYNGSYFAGFQDIIVVTYNFRNTIFGFPGDGPSEIKVGNQNVGLLDQRYVLNWIQKNIAAFGGDPNQVTVAGESSGGWSVKQLMAYPPNPLNFRAAIMESEQTNVSVSTQINWQRIVQYFKCDTASSQLSCMQKVSADNIRYYLDSTNELFNPIGDNITCAISVAPRVTGKMMANVPYISGTNADEGRPFLYGVGIGPNNTNATAAAAFLKTFFPQFPQLYDTVAGFINGFSAGEFEGLSRVITDAAFDCPIMTFDNAMIAAGYVNQWRYYYTATFPNVEDFPDAGAYHSAEIPTVWGTYDFPGRAASAGQTYTQQQAALSKTMNTAWANFIKNPTQGPGFNWPKLSSFPFNPFNVAKFQTTGLTFTNAEEPDIYCPTYATLIAQDGY